MTHEEHMFLSKYLFDKTLEVKKHLKQPISLYEFLEYKQLDNERRKFYEELAYVLIRGLKIDFKNHPPF